MGLLLIHGMISDIAPHDQRKCGRNRAAFLFALTNLLQKAGNATAVGITYAILGAYGFNAARPEDSGELVRNLFIALPFGGWALMALVALALCRESWVNQRRGSAAL
jgi:glycoside/pentoside/hexuronide:cation symporter, GPH family